MDKIANEYLRVVHQRFTEMKKTAERAIDQLNENDLNWCPNEESNSAAVIIKHMSGNMISRWTDLFTTDGEKASRHRDEEFINDINSRNELMTKWEMGWGCLFNVIAQLTEEDLMRTVFIRNEPHSVIEAIERQMYHYSYHIGQIVYIAKQIKDRDWQTLTIPRKR
ncbi:hypothetical protein JOD45_003057 [Scopulibacillus daqui]|uniref:Damage-inducible protein DinB n=1 Tax=Scopulibacillus daqui TaxID=1469162 RepID=A0ABS2Q3L6_9BACL|nr:DUF1572 family protein [Scopulibacillus daqui]MBM7646823.1 hypothetical protein [Scopulibacillus daqui]